MCTNPRKIIINKEEHTVKCGKCDTCRRERQSEWAIKLINEAKYHKKACFITLTFDNKKLMDKNSQAVKYGADLSFIFHIENSKEYFQKFMKRLRKKLGKRITYYHVGEYGEKTKRPHHHLILFGENFDNERIEIQKSKTGHIQYWSPTVDETWACGRTSVQDCNENNIIYISQYAIKKFKANEEENKKYKAKQTFSNRSKMSTKWVRRNYNEIIKGYIETEDHKKFRIPKSYKESLKKSDYEPHKKAYLQFEEIQQDFILNSNNNDLIKNQKIREEQWKIRNFGKYRDCTDFS